MIDRSRVASRFLLDLGTVRLPVLRDRWPGNGIAAVEKPVALPRIAVDGSGIWS